MRKYVRMAPEVLAILGSYYPKIWSMVRKKKRPQEFYQVYHKMIKKACKGPFRIIYNNFHVENVPNSPCIFIPNHIHYFDPITFLGFFDRNIIFIGKKETEKYFLVGNIMKNIGSIFLDRASIRDGIRMINTASKYLNENNDTSIVIFPEGTRTKDKENYSMQEFHPGSFKIAYNTKLPIVPTVLYGTFNILNQKVHKKKYVVTMSFLKPITYEEYKDMTTIELANKVHDMMVEELNKVREDFAIKDKYYNSKMYKKGK